MRSQATQYEHARIFLEHVLARCFVPGTVAALQGGEEEEEGEGTDIAHVAQECVRDVSVIASARVKALNALIECHAVTGDLLAYVASLCDWAVESGECVGDALETARALVATGVCERGREDSVGVYVDHGGLAPLEGVLASWRGWRSVAESAQLSGRGLLGFITGGSEAARHQNQVCVHTGDGVGGEVTAEVEGAIVRGIVCLGGGVVEVWYEAWEHGPQEVAVWVRVCGEVVGGGACRVPRCISPKGRQHELQGPTGKASRLVMWPDELHVGVTQKHGISVFDVATGAQVAAVGPQGVIAACVTPHDTILMLCGGRTMCEYAWRPKAREVRMFSRDVAALGRLQAVDMCGNTVAVGASSGILLVRYDTGEVTNVWDMGKPCRGVIVHPREPWVVTWSDTFNAVKVLGTDGQLVHSVHVPLRVTWPFHITLHPNGWLLILKDDKVHVLSLPHGTVAQIVQLSAQQCVDLAVTQNHLAAVRVGNKTSTLELHAL